MENFSKLHFFGKKVSRLASFAGKIANLGVKVSKFALFGVKVSTHSYSFPTPYFYLAEYSPMIMNTEDLWIITHGWQITDEKGIDNF